MVFRSRACILLSCEYMLLSGACILLSRACFLSSRAYMFPLGKDYHSCFCFLKDFHCVAMIFEGFRISGSDALLQRVAVAPNVCSDLQALKSDAAGVDASRT